MAGPGHHNGSTDPLELGARALGHPVTLALAPEEGLPVVVASLGGEAPRARVAWVDPAGASPVARVACPPGRPSRPRPLVAATVFLAEPGWPADRVLAGSVAPGVAAVRPELAGEERSPLVTVGADGLFLARLDSDAVLLAVDALDRSGEPVGRLIRAGVGELRVSGGSISGRLGIGHGMAAGIGAGRWVESLEEAAFEAGYAPWLPAWIPAGLTVGRPRLEPDGAYPAAPPAVIVAWSGPGDARVLLRQAPAPLASPDPGGPPAREVEIGGARGVLRGRWLPTLVWETPQRAFGLQVRRVPDAVEAALRVARSVPAAGP
jgi:hypothetical protein